MNDDVAALGAQRRELQRRVFSAASDTADARVAARQLQQLDSRLLQATREAARAAALEDARLAVAAPEPDAPPPASALSSGREGGPQHGGESAPYGAVTVPDIVDLSPSRFSALRLIAAVLLALAVGVAVGLSAAVRPAAVPESVPSRSAVDTSGALALFDRPQVESDLPSQALPGTVIGESIRSIGDPFFELYIGRNAANMVCLFAVQPADSFAMSCVTIDEFPSTGVRLEWSGEMSSISADGSAGVVPSTMRAIWRPDGSLDLGGGPR